MNSGAEKIVSSILSDAQGEADAIIQEAETKATSIISEGEEQAQMEKERIIEDAKKQANMKYQQIISEAKMNARRMELEGREEVIDKAFTKAEEKLRNIASTSSAEYIESLKNIVKEASAEIGGGDLLVLLKEEDVSKIKDSLSDIQKEVENTTGNKTTLEIGDNIKTIGGAVVKTKNGEIEVNNTIEARMQRFKKALRSEVAQVLFK
ncbi:MAG: V-type proton ATPase subunit E [Methanobacteriaceae archaeon]|nr:V-type proton ATPase subunit E [Methanobacteriaceae archaeon]